MSSALASESQKRVLVVFPTEWDLRLLPRARRVQDGTCELVWASPLDADCPWDFDVNAFVEAVADGAYGRVDACVTSSDYPGAQVVALLAWRLGLPGPTVPSVLAASHKVLSRQAQKRSIPEATPRFERLAEGASPRVPAFGFPCFVKPARSAFSVLARRVDTAEQLAQYLAAPELAEHRRYTVRMFDELLNRETLPARAGDVIAEELIEGVQVTVEVLAGDGTFQSLGVVDSRVHASGSFARFDYPSTLPEVVKRRMETVAEACGRGLGLRRTLYNVEMKWHAESDRLRIIEVNPRTCGQFADLHEKVDGTSTCDLALDLALGREPAITRGAGPFKVAASVPLRVFEPSRVVSVPSPARIPEVEESVPGLLAWVEVAAGDVLDDFGSEDGVSIRYAVLNVGADSWDELAARVERAREGLGLVVEPLGR